MARFRGALLILGGPIALMLLVMGLELAGQCRESASLGVVCEAATLGAVFALLPAAIAGLWVVLRKQAPPALRAGALLVLALYAALVLFGDKILSW